MYTFNTLQMSYYSYVFTFFLTLTLIVQQCIVYFRVNILGINSSSNTTLDKFIFIYMYMHCNWHEYINAMIHDIN